MTVPNTLTTPQRVYVMAGLLRLRQTLKASVLSKDWEGGAILKDVDTILEDIRLFIEQPMSHKTPKEIRQDGLLWIDRNKAVEQNRELIRQLIGPANPPAPSPKSQQGAVPTTLGADES